MARCLLPLAAALLLSFTVSAASAADREAPPASNSGDMHAEVDSKRAQITGADDLQARSATGAQPLLDAAVVTDDAPTMDDKK